MRILLFCENKYAVDILSPLQEEADRQGSHDVFWYVHAPKIPHFPLDGQVAWTKDMQAAYDFRPEVIFAPGNIVPYYLPGVKIQIFHGYAAEKKDHWVIRRYFDAYFTQGPYFTKHFQKLAKAYGDFEVLETGWTRQDWIFRHLHDFDRQKEEWLAARGKKKLALYAPTFSPKLTSLPEMKERLLELSEKRNVLIVVKLHPLTAKKWVSEYKAWAEKHAEHFVFVTDYAISRYVLMADLLISDTSSSVYEALLQDTPVITLRTIAKELYWTDILTPDDLMEAYDNIQEKDADRKKRKWVIENYDPYLDGKVALRMLEGARDYIAGHGVPEKRNLNLWRKYTSIRTFGRIEHRKK